MSLRPRLNTILELIPENTTRLVDVGCDHGYLSREFLLQYHASNALLIDVNEKPLAKAKSNLSDISDTRLEFSLSSGLNDWNNKPGDCIVIAGIGGKEILSIFADFLEINSKRMSENKNESTYIIIQAMRNQENVRQFFRENNLPMLAQSLVKDGRFTYSVDLYRLDFGQIEKKAELKSTHEVEDYLGEVLLKYLEDDPIEENFLSCSQDSNVYDYIVRQLNIIKSDLNRFAEEDLELRYSLIDSLETYKDRAKNRGKYDT